MESIRFRGCGLWIVAAVFLVATFSSPLGAQCPPVGTLGSRLQSNIVSASFTSDGTTATYSLQSVDRGPVGNVPGLVEYCVYPSNPPGNPTSGVATYGSWTFSLLTGRFNFGRPDGNPSNIPLDGNTYQVGTATWPANTAPNNQTILLHINDAAECDRLYGGNPGTCFVFPGPLIRPKPLTVLKDATPSFDRKYQWTITKSIDHNQINTSGGSATFNYTVTVTHDGGTDSNWQVKGNITVTNPNSFSVTGVNVSDAVNNGGVCTLTGGSNNGVNESIPKGATTFAYNCTYASAPSPAAGTNTVTITWPAQGSLLAGSATSNATFDFSDSSVSNNPKLIDNCVAVSDSVAGSLGTVCVGDSNPKTFSYSRTVSGTPGSCTSYDNTATFTTNSTGTTGSDSKTVKICIGADLIVSKTATPSFTRTYNWSITKSVDKTSVNIASGGSATFNYTVVASETGFTDSAWQVTGTITVTNPNTWETITADVTDAVNNGGSCSVTGGLGVSVPAGGSVSLPYTCTYASAPSASSGTNTATATWDGGAFFTPHGSSTGSAGFAFSSPTKLVNQTVTITDTFNGATTTLGTLTATDPAPFATATYTYSHTVSGVPGTCTTYNNTAKIVETGQTSSQSVQVCVGVDLVVSKTATPSFTRTYSWSVSKSVDKTSVNIASGAGSTTFNYTVIANETGVTDSAWQVTGTITVTNPNNWEAITANVTDAVNNGASCSVTGGTGVSVPAGGSVSLPYTCTYASVPSPSGGTNTATATWDKTAFSTPNGSAAGTASFAFGSPTKLVNQTVTITDTFSGTTTTLGTLTATDSSPFATATYTYLHTVSGVPGTCTTYNNTAKIVETGQTSSQSVKVCVGVDLVVSKTATPTFTRTFHWGISKAVDKTQVNLTSASGTATFNYSVNVTHDAGTDSNWQVAGTIKVTNPNDWEAVVVNVSDAVNDGGNCTVTGGTGVSVPASSSVLLAYACTYSLVPNPLSGTNTVTATWDKTAFFTPNSSATGTATFVFTAPTTIVDGSAIVADSLFGSLGIVSYNDPSPKTFTYSLTFPAPTVPPLCVSYTNAATFRTNTTGTTGSASRTVTVCRVPIPTGALTMGFWQNKNGQGIITGGSSTAGVCNSATWLRQFAPFQDLSTTATCSQVATYVYNTIKAATAGGATMNPMLKAQMLATALDVYFSDPALGGNQIGAPVPIGGVSIDLTLICSGGCNTGSAFGGATCLTVSQLLSYAASQSNVGGSVWYGNVKATQELAKDTFDAINNQVAFGC